MTTLFGGWEPQIIVIPPDIPADPIINVAPPAMVEPVTHITATRRVSAGGDKAFTNTISDVGLAYALKDNQTFTNLTITDHVCDDKSGLLRAYAGVHIGKLVVERLSQLRGHYSGGVCCGAVQVGSAVVDEITLRDINYEREQFIKSPGDVYAGLFMGGGKDLDGAGTITCNSLLIENCRSRNTFVDYTQSSDPTAYPNSDAIVCEKTIHNVLIRNVDLRFGSDSGIDMKGINCRAEAAICEGFRQSFKWWSEGQDGDVYTANARQAHWVLPASGKIVERVVEFAAIVQNDPTKPLVDFQKQPHKLILLKGYFEGDPSEQVLARAESAAFGATVQMGDKSITISKPITMLSELLS